MDKRILTLLLIMFAVFILIGFPTINSHAQNVHDGSCACGRRDQIPMIMNPSGRGIWLGVEQQVADIWNNYVPIIQISSKLLSVITKGDGEHDVGMFNFKSDVAPLLNAPPGPRDEAATQLFSKNGPCEPDGSCPLNECNPDCRLTETNIYIYQGSDIPCKRWTSFTDVWPNQRAFLTPCDPHLLESVLLHEFGHALGLKHNFTNFSAMNYARDVAAQYVTLADVNALRARYPDLAVEVEDLATYPFVFTEPRNVEAVRISKGRLTPGDTFEINNFTIENLGTSAAEDVRLIFVMYNFIFNRNSHSQAGVFKLGEMQISSIPKGGFVEVRTPVTLTMPLLNRRNPGLYWIGAIIAKGTTDDIRGFGFEDSIEYNNKWTSDVIIELLGEDGMSVPIFSPSPDDIVIDILADSVEMIEEGTGIFDVVGIETFDDDSISDPVPEPDGGIGQGGGNGFQPGDANADGFVNLADILVVINVFLNPGTTEPGNGDCNMDGFVNLGDILCIIDIFLNPQ